MRARCSDDLRSGVALVIDAHSVPTTSARCDTIVAKIIEEENVAADNPNFAFKRAVDRFARLLKPKKM